LAYVHFSANSKSAACLRQAGESAARRSSTAFVSVARKGVQPANALLLAAAIASVAYAQDGDYGGQCIRHVLLISIDGMHALDFINCSKRIGEV
jgi:hypothetical protein